jgi:hypothetical protein
VCERLAELRQATQELAKGFDGALLDLASASAVLRDATTMKNVCATIEAMAAARVAECGDWAREGNRSAAEHIAKQTGTSRGAAAEALRRAERLRDQPEVDAAARSGRLSPDQASAIAGAGEVAPAATQELLDRAPRQSLEELRRDCAALRNAHTDPEERRRRIQGERFLRRYDDAEGAAHIHAKGNPEDVAQIMARIEAERDKVFAEARREGRAEDPAAYAFDALLRLCRGEAKAVAVANKVITRIDLDSFLRGYPTEGETCDVAGVPVSGAGHHLERRRLPGRGVHPRRAPRRRGPLRPGADGQAADRPRMALPHLCGRGMRARCPAAARPPRRLGEEQGHAVRTARPVVRLPPPVEDA